MTAGTIIIRTTNASKITPNVHVKPIILVFGSVENIKPPNTATIIIRNLRNHKQQTMTEFAGSTSITIIENVCNICGISMCDFFKMLEEIEVNIDTYIKDPILEQYKIKQGLHALIDTLTDDQQKALYVFLLPYQK